MDSKAAATASMIWSNGIGLILTGNGHTLLLTLTTTFGGKQSSCSQDVSNKQNRNWTCMM